MRYLRHWLVAAAFSFLASASFADDTTDFFNGKDLTGWKGLPEYWSVRDGAIVGKHEGLKFNTFLCSEKMFGDFELRCNVKLVENKGNSGFQIRSKIIDKEKWVVAGPQADIGAGYWGSLYGEKFGGMMKASKKDDIKIAVKENDFNDFWIQAVGKKITIKINGTAMVDEDFEKAPDEGIIAFQIHTGGPMEVIFKDIKFKKLTK